MPRVLLKNVVTRIKDKVDKDNTELEYYIGGEHFDNGEIQITRKGIIKESTIGPAFHMRFQPGDVLLMSRNPHLRKAGVVDFEGICSDVSYVCRTKDENVLMQSLIPFIFQTDHFWRFAEENKKGSTNFFLNWSDFEKYEFDLPEIDKQKKLCEMMWAFEDTKSAYKQLLLKTDELVKSQFIEMFGDPASNPMGWLKEPLEKHAEVIAGKPFDSKRYTEEGINICGGLIIMPDRIAWEDCKHWPTTEGLEQFLLAENDIVLAMDRPWISEGFKIAKIKQSELPALLIQRTARIRGRDLDQDFLLYMIKHPQFEKHCNITATTVPHISMKDINGYYVIVPPIELQREYAEVVHQSDKSKFELKQAIADIDNLMRTFMAQSIEKEE